MEKLSKLIQDLKAPKNQRNSFGGYNYRSAEDILEAVKPLLHGAILTISDEIMLVGDRFYVKATATYRHGDFEQSATAFAREPLAKKGMDESQITGAASSYARKYALNGLLCIDDTKDADATNTHGKTPAKGLSAQCENEISMATSVDELRNIYAKYLKTEPQELLQQACETRKLYIEEGGALL